MNLTIAKEKARALVCQMTSEEKMSQLLYDSPAIERLGIHAHNWWNEASHGVARAGIATVFPHAIALAATFHPELIKEVADATSTEARAKYNKSVAFGDRGIYMGLTYCSPNINIFRDPRWGRGQETFGEDPYLTAAMGTAYIKGLQGDGEFMKATACAKHFAVHSGPEKLRHTFDAQVSDKELYETYLPAFYQAVKAGVAGFMGAYNELDGEPCCASSRLIQETLRKQWQFDGCFVSDYGAIADISETHHYADTLKEASAVALKTGCNLNLGEAYSQLNSAYQDGLISDEDITEAAVRVFSIRFLLGEFEKERPFREISYDLLDCDAHKALNLEAAKQTMVLLKNEEHFLPISTKRYRRIAVVGPNANSVLALEGNYNGHASEYVTVADGIRRTFPDSRIFVAEGAPLCFEKKNPWDRFSYLRSEGLAAASEAELTVLCLGLDCTVEGEENALNNNFTDGGDKKTLHLPDVQMALAETVCDVCENVIVVVLCGSAVDLGEKVRKHAKAIIHGWYPGAQGGLAVSQLLAGEYSPSGKLPLTFYHEETQLPDFTDYCMEGRTYRFVREEPLYPFGYGLSYTTFRYDAFKVVSADADKLQVSVTLTNTGSMTATEKVQIYARYTDSRTKTPNYQLCGTAAVVLSPGETKTADIELDRYWIKAVLDDGSRVDPNGEITLFAGGHQPDTRSNELCGYPCIQISLQ